MSKRKKDNLPILADEYSRDYNMADWKYEKIIEQIKEFESFLDDDHEIGLKLASFGSSVIMSVTDIGYQNPDILYFYGFVDGKEAQLIQHISQLSFLITSIEKEDKEKPARRIGFALPTLKDESDEELEERLRKRLEKELEKEKEDSGENKKC